MKTEALLDLLAGGYSDADVVRRSFDPKTGAAKLDDGDSLGHFVVSEALSVADDNDPPDHPVEFELGFAFTAAARELSSLALHCRQAGIAAVVHRFLAWSAKEERPELTLRTFESWFELHIDRALASVLDDCKLHLLAQFPGPPSDKGFVLTREALLQYLGSRKV